MAEPSLQPGSLALEEMRMGDGLAGKAGGGKRE